MGKHFMKSILFQNKRSVIRCDQFITSFVANPSQFHFFFPKKSIYFLNKYPMIGEQQNTIIYLLTCNKGYFIFWG